MPFGLSITDKSIKIAKPQGRKLRLIKAKLPEGIVEEGFVKDEAKLKEILTLVFKEVGLRNKEVVLGISERHVFTKAITISDKEASFEDRIKEKLESYLPTPIEASYTDWQIVKKTEEEEMVLVTSAPSDLLDPYVAVLRSIPVSVVGIEPLGFALACKAPKGLATSLFIIAFEEEEVLLTIVNEQGKLVLTSVLPQKLLSDTTELLSEISNMRSFYEKNMLASSEESKPIGKVFITGEAATEELRSKLSLSLSLEAEFLRIENPSVSKPDSLSFFLAFALIDLPIKVPKDHAFVNLIPQEMLVLQEKIRRASHIKKLMIVSASVFGVFCAVYLALLTYLFFEQRAILHEIERKKEVIQTGEALEVRRQISELGKYIKVVKRVAKDDFLSTILFLSEKTPTGITITHYKVDLVGGKTTLSGLSSERERLLAFRQVLEAEGKFDVQIPLASLEKKGAATFSLSFEERKK